MIYPMHCTWLNRHIIFNNNTFHQKKQHFFFFKFTVDLWHVPFAIRMLQVSRGCVGVFSLNLTGASTMVLLGLSWRRWWRRGPGVQKITRLPMTSFCTIWKVQYIRSLSSLWIEKINSILFCSTRTEISPYRSVLCQLMLQYATNLPLL